MAALVNIVAIGNIIDHMLCSLKEKFKLKLIGNYVSKC